MLTPQADIARLRAGVSGGPVPQQPPAHRRQYSQGGGAVSGAASRGPDASTAAPAQHQRSSPSHDDLPVGGSAGGPFEMPPEYLPGSQPEEHSAGPSGDAGSPGGRPAVAMQRQPRPSLQHDSAGSPGKQLPVRTPPAMQRATGIVILPCTAAIKCGSHVSLSCIRPSEPTLRVL